MLACQYLRPHMFLCPLLRVDSNSSSGWDALYTYPTRYCQYFVKRQYLLLLSHMREVEEEKVYNVKVATAICKKRCVLGYY